MDFSLQPKNRNSDTQERKIISKIIQCRCPKPQDRGNKGAIMPGSDGRRETPFLEPNSRSYEQGGEC